MATSIEHKRGDTFLYSAVLRESKNGPVMDITDWVIKSQIRTLENALIATATVTITDSAQGAYTVRVDNTRSWPVHLVAWDIEYTDNNGIIRSTETIQVQVIQDVTLP